MKQRGKRGTVLSDYAYNHPLFTENRKLYGDSTEVVENELNLSGYFAIITSEKMTAKEAIPLYKSRDTSEKLFCGDKSYILYRYAEIKSKESEEHGQND